MEFDPKLWETVPIGEIQAVIDGQLMPKVDIRLASGRVLVPKHLQPEAGDAQFSGLSCASVLVDALGTDELRRAAAEWLEETSEPDILLGLVKEHCQVLICSVWSSMVSGSWGIGSFTLGERGYLYFEPGAEDEYHRSRPILAAWEPKADGEAFRACFLTMYESWWDKLMLPPELGECAIGPSEMMIEAICRLLPKLSSDSRCWKDFENTLLSIRDDGPARSDWDPFEELLNDTARLTHVPFVVVSQTLSPIWEKPWLTKEEVLANLDLRAVAEQERRVLVAAFVSRLRRHSDHLHTPSPFLDRVADIPND